MLVLALVAPLYIMAIALWLYIGEVADAVLLFGSEVVELRDNYGKIEPLVRKVEPIVRAEEARQRCYDQTYGDRRVDPFWAQFGYERCLREAGIR